MASSKIEKIGLLRKITYTFNNITVGSGGQVKVSDNVGLSGYTIIGVYCSNFSGTPSPFTIAMLPASNQLWLIGKANETIIQVKIDILYVPEDKTTVLTS